MKYYYYIPLLVLLITFASNAQVTVTNKGVEITNTSNLYINGNYINATAGSIANGGNIYITNDITNTSIKDLFVTASGKVILTGSTTQNINGDSINFFSLIINKPSGEAVLNKTIYVADTLNMLNGNIHLNGSTIHLGLTGRLYNEKNSSRIYGSSGVITSRLFLSSSSITQNISGLGIYIASPSNFGFTDISRGHGVQHSNGDTSIYRYFDIFPVDNTKSGLINKLKISYLDKEVAPGENTYKIYSSSDNGFSWLNKGGTVDTINNTIETTTLSPPEIKHLRVAVFPIVNYATCLPNDPDYISAVFLVSTNDFKGDSVKFIQLTEGANQNFIWNFGDQTTNVIERDPIHIYNLPDTTKTAFIVSIKVTNGICSDTRVKKIIISNKPVLRIQDDQTLYDLFQTAKIYPNPVSDDVSIELSSSGKWDVTVLVLDAVGSLVKETTLKAGSIKQQISFSDISQGIYVIKLQAGEDQKVFKIVKL